MTLEEIDRIEDPTIRNIRTKYWNMKHRAFLDEHGIPDTDLARIFDELSLKEEQEVAAYLTSINSTGHRKDK